MSASKKSEPDSLLKFLLNVNSTTLRQMYTGTFFYESFWGWPAQDSCHRAQEASPKCCGGCGVPPDPVLIHSVDVGHSGRPPGSLGDTGTKVELIFLYLRSQVPQVREVSVYTTLYRAGTLESYHMISASFSKMPLRGDYREDNIKNSPSYKFA